MVCVAFVAAVVMSACSAQVSEVRTNSGGTLDCPSETILYAAINPVPDAAASSPGEALALLGDDFTPPGVPVAESEGAQQTVFLYRDSDGHRQGRVIVVRGDSDGWLPQATERCG
jgi:hypothetical protein